MRRMKMSWASVLPAILLAACAPMTITPQLPPAPGQAATPSAPAESPTAPPEATVSPEPTAPATVDLAPAPGDLVLVPPTEAPFVGPLPADLETRLLADLEARTGLARASFTLIRAEAVTWNDGSLGCPQPGMFYTQALVEGYWVVWQAGDQQYDYRATQRGAFILCEPAPAGQPGLPPTAVIVIPPGSTLPGDNPRPTEAP